MPDIRFRDGPRWVPDTVASLFEGLKTQTMTYDEAIKAGNDRQIADYANRVQRDIVAEHMRKLNGRG